MCEREVSSLPEAKNLLGDFGELSQRSLRNYCPSWQAPSSWILFELPTGLLLLHISLIGHRMS